MYNISKKILTVIIPVFNVEKYLEKCLSTVLIKDERVQYIIVNDGSTDGSLKIIRKNLAKYSNIIFINQKNKGLSMARNAGLELANTKWVTFIDSDDFTDNFRIEKLLNVLEGEDNDLIILPVMKYENSNLTKLQDIEGRIDVNKYIFDIMTNSLELGVWAYVFKLQIIREHNIKFDKGRRFEDKYFIPKYLKWISNIIAISSNKVGYYYYRMRFGSLTHEKNTIEKINDWYDSGKYITNEFSVFKSLDSGTIKAINRYRYMILFRTYVDLLKINQESEAFRIRKETKELEKYDKLGISFKILCKIFIISIPPKVLSLLLNYGDKK